MGQIPSDLLTALEKLLKKMSESPNEQYCFRSGDIALATSIEQLLRTYDCADGLRRFQLQQEFARLVLQLYSEGPLYNWCWHLRGKDQRMWNALVANLGRGESATHTETEKAQYDAWMAYCQWRQTVSV